MEQSLVICNKCGSHNSKLYYLNKTDEYYCETCNEIFSKNEVFGFSWAEDILNKMNIDKQMDNMVQESTDNLQHEIIMTRIFKKKAIKIEKEAVKVEEKAILSNVDTLLEEIFAM